ncbi:MAG TPA: hypothetical protein VFE62_11845, partial [Gemmataceae bacterium]|nr:hypothetical protein [Gemmataceae bacterium]
MATNGTDVERSNEAVGTRPARIRGIYGFVLAALALILIVPIWLVDYPPLVDYPNHLARGYILYHHDDVASFRDHFDVDYFSTPSLAMDLFLVALQPICDVRTG